MNLLEMKNVKKSFGDLQVLKDISLTVADGEIVSIIGPSGSGKSTLMNLIGGIDKPTEGSVTIDGKEIYQYGERK